MNISALCEQHKFGESCKIFPYSVSLHLVNGLSLILRAVRNDSRAARHTAMGPQPSIWMSLAWTFIILPDLVILR